MKITTSKGFFLLFPVLILIASCQKGIDPDNPPVIPDKITDSTLLIKSITTKVFDPISGLPGEDSIKENYFYDTVNRKIIIKVDHAASSPYINEAEVEHSYDANGLLINVSYKYRNGYLPADDDKISVKLDYDANKVIQKIAIRYQNGDTRNVIFEKTAYSANKYKLSWQEPLWTSQGEHTADVNAVFNEAGNLFRTEYIHSYNTSSGGGVEAYARNISIDSLYYDGNGSVNKVEETYIDSLYNINETVIGCEFNSRQSKGDQLFNLRQVMLNGIANIPFGEDLFRGVYFRGIISFPRWL